ncbi:HEXXH motif domain-containing protein [Nonomuraea longispora]|uniref:HEXXH motif domain-containing protein n=1 Tax=Nonomuraea longispora TaxID=1848320 RepID=A0A4R4NBV1_9ACTN|nr:HEXXH motif domain-containing protein [Nonomuraea longispora]TDC05724.1 HEXXH motif domain-containing protein [Nonomuraea longispora]
MKPRRHNVSDDVFAALAAGRGGAAAVRRLAAVERSKHLLLLRGLVESAATTGHPAAGRTADAYDRLAALQDDAPDAVEAVVCYPAVGAWLRSTLLALGSDPEQARPDQLAAVTAAAAIRARAQLSIEVRTSSGALFLPSLGEVRVPGGTATVRSTAGGAEVVSGSARVVIPDDRSQDVPGWRGLRRLTAYADGKALDLVLDDVDPYRMPADVAGRLPEAELRSWRSALQEAWGILTAHHPSTAAEIQVAHRVLTPLRRPPRGQVSGTASETFGTVGMSPPSDGLTLAATLAHEVQHAKLGALSDIVRLLDADDGRRFYAPWREDPRPAAGLLHGAYAYLGVTAFWRHQRHHERGERGVLAHSEFARWRAGAGGAVDVLMASGLLTSAGKRFVAQMRRVLAAWQDEPVPASAQARARAEAEGHLARWRRAHGHPAFGTSRP